jgi:hypothetical protein
MEEDMRLWSGTRLAWRKLWLGAILLALTAPAAYAQHRVVATPSSSCPPAPCAPSILGIPQTPPGTPPSGEAPPRTEPVLQPSDTAFADVGRGGVGFGETGAFTAAGYIDSAIPVTQFRFRYDSSYRNNRPDRAEFFYAKCGCFRDLGDFDAPGPPLLETSVDYQDLSAYLEVAATERLSGFVELPVRFINPEQNANSAGLADMYAGVKYALIADPCRYVTFQFRTWFPTGDADRGLGNDHVSLEPGILLYELLTDKLILEAEVKDWIPIDGTDFAGNILRYGVGLSYLVVDRPTLRAAPVAEFVGWSVLGGKELAVASIDPPVTSVQDADHDTIVNVKLGVRIGFGEQVEPTIWGGSDFYVGYGRALTGDVWYKDTLRVEYRLRF